MKLDPDEDTYDDTIPLTSSTSASSAWDQPCMDDSSNPLDLNSPFSAIFNEKMHIFAMESKSALLATGYLSLSLSNAKLIAINRFASTCYLLSWFQEALIPFFLSIFLMYLVDPLVQLIDVSPRQFLCFCTSSSRLTRRASRGCSRAFSSSCAILIIGSFFGLLGYIIVVSVHALDMASYQIGYNDLVTNIETISNGVGVPLNITTTLHDNVEKVARIIITQTMDLLSVMFVTSIYLLYFLATRTRVGDIGGVWSRVDRDIQRFVSLKCFVSLFVAVLVTIVYVWLNVGLAIVWGILTFILNWIPNVGAIIASALPMVIIVITPSNLMNPMEKFLAIVLPMSFHMFVGNFIEPKVFGRKLELDPVIVILSLSAWGLLWGVVGMMLSVPLTAAFKIMLSHLKLWPELVALMEGTYFVKYGINSTHKKIDREGFEAMQMQTQLDKIECIHSS
uniref:Transmembrane protein putative n=1 Tax=Albugo laibachii Nc14 TaxID=890382 RepID=F0W526_9STRA|nr:transmembrane protein putative [Albugo laibachii Nc14]|eukprot:CCA16217.1 transmembrane protein putative [Albugo laibachii Nc14]